MRATASHVRAGFVALSWLAVGIVFSASLLAQQQLGTVVGQVQVERGDFPPHQVLVSLVVHGAVMQSSYTDGQGRFGFYALPLNLYYVDINDEEYQPAHERVDLSPWNANAVVQITLIPKPSAKTDKPATQLSGGNPNVMDVREYAKRFPKKAFQEFQKGVKADQEGKREEAIRHYDKAVEIAPDFYPAHDNLGSDQLARNDLKDARSEFAKVIQLNQNDAAGYLNLANVCMLMGQLPEAQHYLDEGLRRQPNSPLGKFLQGSLEMRTGKLAEAEQSLRQTMQVDPAMAQARLQLIVVLLKEGKKPEAVNELKGFVKAFPASPFRPKAEQLLQRLNAPAPTAGGPS